MTVLIIKTIIIIMTILAMRTIMIIVIFLAIETNIHLFKIKLNIKYKKFVLA